MYKTSRQVKAYMRALQKNATKIHQQ